MGSKFKNSSCILLLLVSIIFKACFAEDSAIYLVLVEGEPIVFHGNLTSNGNGKRADCFSESVGNLKKNLEDVHDQILQSTLEPGSYNKLYSFKHVVNGFSVHTTPSQVSQTLSNFQARKLQNAPGVKLVEKDRGARKMTTYTPDFLDLPLTVWTQEGGDRRAGEGIVIGFVDTGINPAHPSFGIDLTNPFTSNLSGFSVVCETGPLFPPASCNGKIVSARFFSAGARAAAELNSSVDILSPFDAVGHGSHVASIAAGNAGVPVVVDGFFYGRASGMAPRARIAVYKAVYPTVGTLSDVVAAIDQAVIDGVDILTLSIGPDEPPEDTPTLMGVFDIVMLFARKAGVFVVQAAGNRGPAPSTVLSFSPWAIGAAAGTTDRAYPGSLLLGNGQQVAGIGLSGPTFGGGLLQYKLVLAKDAIRGNGTLPITAEYVEECQHPEAFDPIAVLGSIVICTFSDGFYNQTSTLYTIINTGRALQFMGFVLLANPKFGDFVAEPIPFSVSGILVPKVLDSQIVTRYYEQQTYRDARGVVTQFGARAAIEEGRNAVFTGSAPVVSSFSSRGPDFIDTKGTLLDVLKPDFLAPGHQIWAAWSPVSALDPILTGRSFALLSGTSMATPHIAGIAALIKQHNPSWTPSMIASAISTTAMKYNNNGDPIMMESYDIDELHPSNHFDFGAGHVNPARALDPGLVLSAGFDDYIGFLCSVPNINRFSVRDLTGVWCPSSVSHPANLNLPSVTISELKGSLVVKRSFLNVGNKTETYLGSVRPPNGTLVILNPPWFTIPAQGTQELDIQFNVIDVVDEFRFGEVVLTGSLNHIVRIPLTVKTVI